MSKVWVLIVDNSLEDHGDLECVHATEAGAIYCQTKKEAPRPSAWGGVFYDNFRIEERTIDD